MSAFWPKPPSPHLSLALVCAWSGLIVACDPVPESCERMCEAAQLVQSDCLAEDGVGWEATADKGWGSPEAFVHSCETWAWEAQRLQSDAWWRGERDGERIRDTCAERDLALRGAPECATLERVGWQLPWEDDDDGA